MKTMFGEMGGTYKRRDDYLLQNVKLPEEGQREGQREIGVSGQRHGRYLKQYSRVSYYIPEFAIIIC